MTTAGESVGGYEKDMAQKHTQINRPLARSERLAIESVGDETVIYDLDSHVAHALKPLAAAVYNYADGSNTAAEIAELVSYRLAQQVSESDVNEAVEQLDALSLLDTPELDIAGGVSRRDALKVFAAAGAGAALISSVAAPAAFAGMAANGCSYVCGDGCEDMCDTHGNKVFPQVYSNKVMVEADFLEFIGRPCDTSNGNCNSGGSAVLSKAYCSSVNDGVYVPTATTCAPGYAYSSSTKKCSAAGKSSYTPSDTACVPGNTSTWFYNNGSGDGTYMCVPCDGNVGVCHWQSCQVVCVKAGTPVPSGTVTNPGSNPYTQPCGGSKQAKYCTPNPCNTKNPNCPTCS